MPRLTYPRISSAKRVSPGRPPFSVSNARLIIPKEASTLGMTKTVPPPKKKPAQVSFGPYRLLVALFSGLAPAHAPKPRVYCVVGKVFVADVRNKPPPSAKEQSVCSGNF